MKSQPLLHAQQLLILIFLYHSIWAQPSQICTDTSFRIRYASSDNINFGQHITTSDLGIIAVGGTSQATLGKLHGLIVKFDVYGNRSWSKKINVTGNASMILREVRELKNGDYLVGAELIDDTTKIYLARLNASGHLQWQKVFLPDARFDVQDAVNLYAFEEGANNELFFSFRGSHTDITVSNADSSYNLIAKLDGNGNLLWSKGFAVSGSSLTFPSTNPIGLYSDNGGLLVFGQVIDMSSLCPTQNYTLSGTTFFGMALNESTGALQAMKSYCYHEMPTNQWTSAYVKRQFGSSRLPNDRFALFGRFYSTSSSGNFLFNVAFDTSLNIFRPSLYQIPKASNTAQIIVQRNGDVNLFFQAYPANQYWAQLDSSNVLKRQRRMLLPPVTSLASSTYDFRPPYYTTYTSNYQADNKWYVEFSQLQDHDPAIDACMGVDTAFITALPFNVTPSNFSWRSLVSNPVISSAVNYAVTDISLQQETICTTISRCDSLRIAGPDTVCTATFANFTGLKNAACRKRVLWQLDNALIDSSYQPNDSTLSVRFKPLQSANAINTQLYASAANCTVAKDTTQLILVPGIRPLPPDTVVCGNVIIRLTPGKWGKNYLWQDGSTDSVFIATDTGRYTVQVQTVCGTLFRDTFNITRPTVSLGADKMLCTGDSITLQATQGFGAYQWRSGSVLLSTNNSSLTVSPGSTAQYSVAALTAGGCTFSDTIIIYVLQAPLIHLGGDTSFCTGDSVRLEAPLSFNSYQWSNGDTNSFIAVKTSGGYWVKAIDGKGCSASDSINILPLYPKPVVNIVPKIVVCVGQSDTLRAGSFASYSWSNGSNKSYLPITGTGKYWLRVVDGNGCAGNDTAFITKLAVPPTAFLLKDTIVCSGDAVELKSLKNFRNYWWSNGASTPFITVNNTGLYSLRVTDGDGCTGADSVRLSLKDCPNKIFFPSAFTPNGDGKNDWLKPFVEGRMADYKFTVYNRWGQVVFSTNDYRRGWDGKFGDAPQTTGAFVWLCQYRFAGEEKKTAKGTVMLMR